MDDIGQSNAKIDIKLVKIQEQCVHIFSSSGKIFMVKASIKGRLGDIHVE
jgi:hypothetical protein